MTLVSAVMVTLNERRMLDFALRSAMLVADEVIVGDMGSTDGSRELALELGAVVVDIERAPAVEQVRPDLVARAKGAWILLLDPDEVIEPRLARRLRRVVEENEVDAVSMVYRPRMMGAPISDTGWGPVSETHLRLFRRDTARLHRTVHATIEPVEGARSLALSVEDGVVHHFNYVSWEQFIDKLNRYTTVEAADPTDSSATVSTRGLARELLGEAYYRGIRGRAWREGWRGPVLVLLMLAYRASVYAKRRLEQELGGDAGVVAADRRWAETVLAEGDGNRSDGS